MRPSAEEPSPQGPDPQPEPQIIGPDNHPIKISMIDRDALYVLKKLSKAGFAGYLVGGGVRDLYLGKAPKDFDISTNARPGQLRKLFPNSKTIGRRFRLVQIFFPNGKTIEVSTLRSLSEYDLDGPETVLAPNNTFGTLSEDARRRDLTINSLFYEIENNTIIDYVGGIQDLKKAVIQIVGNPDKRISRDPVRIMRAIRHSARNNFTIEKKTLEAIYSNCHKISLCPPSRLRDEFLKDLYSGSAASWFKLALPAGLFTNLFPVYQPLLAENQTDSQLTAERLEQIFKTIDRTNKLALEHNIHRQPDHFLITLILAPWLEHTFSLYSSHIKGVPLFQLSKKIRALIDSSVGTSFNLRRSSRQEIVSLAINLAQLLHNRQKTGWPKWLQKKSYFRKCLLFYYFYLETQEKTQVKLETLLNNSRSKLADNSNPLQKKTSAPRYRPAFALNTKGGVFGFRK